eukprot:CAMPEP_0197008720 /NCGR_PEP_ID=MMETSP1380-20130617/46608_1 /TAXON_ID=5936 /ORGANISM="Euplotes crassus, Strain CT5" /LENGTH=65 /DNA_ID=CAMNT_0042429489 /DNA_START=340 /DNA_END=537 /DNA_ORIENTATION=-
MKVIFAQGAHADPPNTNLRNLLFPTIGPTKNKARPMTNNGRWKALKKFDAICGHTITSPGSLVSV